MKPVGSLVNLQQKIIGLYNAKYLSKKMSRTVYKRVVNTRTSIFHY